MPTIMRYTVKATLTVTVTADDGSIESYAVQGTEKANSVSATLPIAIRKAIREAEGKAAMHAQAVFSNETERLQ